MVNDNFTLKDAVTDHMRIKVEYAFKPVVDNKRAILVNSVALPGFTKSEIHKIFRQALCIPIGVEDVPGRVTIFTHRKTLKKVKKILPLIKPLGVIVDVKAASWEKLREMKI